MNFKELNLFLVKNDTNYKPIFYVEALDILEATRKATKIVKAISDEKQITSISAMDFQLVEIEE